jgi:hypothetical protein
MYTDFVIFIYKSKETTNQHVIFHRLSLVGLVYSIYSLFKDAISSS